LKKQINMVDRTTPSTFENKDKAIKENLHLQHLNSALSFLDLENTLPTSPKLQMIWFFFTCYTPKLILAGVFSPLFFTLPSPSSAF